MDLAPRWRRLGDHASTVCEQLSKDARRSPGQGPFNTGQCRPILHLARGLGVTEGT